MMSFGKSLGGLAAVAVVLSCGVAPVLAVEATAIEGKLDRNSETLSDGSFYEVHTFEGTEGEAVFIELESQDFDAYLLLVDPEGSRIAEGNGGGEGRNARIAVALPATGTYRILANTFEKEETGSYRLSWRDATETEVEEYQKQSQASSILQEGIRQFSVSQFREALSSWEQSLRLYRELGDRQGEANSLGNLGAAYNFLGDYQQAIAFHQQYLDIAREIGDRQGEANSLGNLGNAYNALGDYQQAIAFHQQSLGIAREIGNRQGEATSLGNLGNAYFSLGDYQQAIAFHQQHLEIAREIGDRQGEANSLGNLGNAYQSLGDYQQAIAFLQQTLAIVREIGDRRGEAASLGNLGIAYNSLGDYQQAIAFHQQYLEIARAIGDRRGEAASLSNLGNDYQSLGDYQQAIAFHQQSLAIMREIGDRQGEAASLNNLGNAYRNLGDYQQAIAFHQQSLAIMREIGDRQGEANSLGNLGIAYDALGDYQQAIAFHQQSLAIKREIGDRQGEATSLGNLGNAYRNLGDYQQAIAFHQQHLEIAREIGDRQGEANSLGNLGVAYQFLGDYQQAIAFHQQSLAIDRAIGYRQGEAADLGNLGVAYQFLGDYQQAIAFHQQSLAIKREIGDRQGEANSLGNLGLAYDALGDYQQAIAFHQQHLEIAREIGDREGEANSLGNFGIAYDALGDYQQALAFHQQSLAIDRAIGDREGEANSLNNLGVTYRSLEDYERAISNFQQSAELSLELRRSISRINRSTLAEDREVNLRSTFVDSRQFNALNLVELLIRQERVTEALTWASRFTTSEIADYSRLIGQTLADPEAQNALGQWQQKNQQLNAIRQQLEQEGYPEALTRRMRALEREVFSEAETLIDTYPDVAELLETTPEDIDRLQANIPPGTLVVQPVRLDESIALFLLGRDRPATVTEVAIDPQAFDALLDEYRQQLVAPPQASDSQKLQAGQEQLYDLLIRPIEAAIADANPERLSFILTGKLRAIPLETLYDSASDEYLLAKYPIHYLTRISSRRQPPRSATPQPPKILAFGNPVPRGPQHLPGAEAEAQAIANLFPDSQAYLNSDASLEQFQLLAPQFPYLHLATHGCFQPNGCPDIGLEANTILFSDRAYNIADASQLGLTNTELVVLSACQTTLEATATGEEIAGLAYIFERAGAKAVIATLWNANDDTTREIMVEFYQQLQQGKSKSEALRQAKLIYANNFDHPSVWSHLVLIGDGR